MTNGPTTGIKIKLKLQKIPKYEKIGDPCQLPLRLGPEHELIMALTVQPDTQDACGMGSGPFAALGCTEVR